MAECKICNYFVRDGIHLSNGGIIHEKCYEDSLERRTNVIDSIAVKNLELKKLNAELQKRRGLLYKVRSVFSNQNSSIEKVESSILEMKSEIEVSENELLQLNSKLTPVFDYFLTYPADWDERRLMVKERGGARCRKCAARANIHVHHIKPLSKGGNNKLANLVLLCESCHSKVHGGRDLSGNHKSSESAFSKRLSNINYAIENGKRIKFGYKKLTDDGHIQRTVNPEKIISVDHQKDSGSTLCVQGYCELRKAERVFALKRMRGLKVL